MLAPTMTLGYRDRRRRQRVEQPREARRRTPRDPGHHHGQRHHDRGGHRRDHDAGSHRVDKDRVAQDVGVVRQRRLGRRVHERLRQVREKRLPGEREQRQAERNGKHQEDGDRHRPAPAAEFDAGRHVAFAGDRGECLGVARCAPIEIHRDQADDEQQKAERAGDAEFRRRLDGGVLNPGGENLDTRRQADDARHLVGRQAHDKEQQEAGQNGGAQQRQRDLRHHLPVAAAGDESGFLHAHVERAQRRPKRQIGEGEIMARQRPDHAGHGIDVERCVFQTERRFQHGVDPADVGAEHENPRHGHQQAGNGERQQRQIMKQHRARRVGALDRPGDEAADHKGDDRGAGRVDHRIADQPQQARARIGLDEIVEREGAEAEPGVFGERSEQQTGERHQHQPQPDGDANDQQKIRPPPARRGIVGRWNVGHKRCSWSRGHSVASDQYPTLSCPAQAGHPVIARLQFKPIACGYWIIRFRG